jgi:hypothetical protein
VWPFWVRRQFDPLDKAFVPRSFALTQVNLTNRNWTAVGLPDHTAYPIVDPRGLVTPYFDPEGISFVYRVGVDSGRRRWTINDAGSVVFDPPMHRHVVSAYKEGDVYWRLLQRKEKMRKTCQVGMATAAAIYPLRPEEPVRVCLDVALDGDQEAVKAPVFRTPGASSWKEILNGVSRLRIPDERRRAIT